jgi:DNA-binding response OmpR family regulator
MKSTHSSPNRFSNAPERVRPRRHSLLRNPVPQPPPRPAQPGTRVLLVDDDATVRESLGDVLVSEGFLVVPAEDGQQAVELACNDPVDLVLLDLNLPVKSGWDTFEQLTREHPLTPIIIATARPNQLFTALNAGVGALLEKPLEIPVLLQTIRKLLNESAEERLARLAGKKTGFHYQPANARPA